MASVTNVTADADGIEDTHEAKRFAILSAAARIFNEKGFHETSMTDVADALGVTKPFLYYYIENKQDLVEQCSGIATKQLHELIDSTIEAKGAVLHQLQHLLRMYAKVMTTDFGVCLIRNTAPGRFSPKRTQLWAGRRRMNKRVESLIAQGIADGSIRSCDPKKVSFAIFGAFNWMTFWYDPNGHQSPEILADEFFNIFLRGIAAENEDDYAGTYVV